MTEQESRGDGCGLIILVAFAAAAFVISSFSSKRLIINDDLETEMRKHLKPEAFKEKP